LSRRLAPCLAVALAALATAPAAAAAGRRSSGTLAYPEAASLTLASPTGDARSVFQLSLRADPDINGRVSDLDMVLRRNGRGPNLLEPAGLWHGAQAFSLAAQEFRDGPDKSRFGALRVFDLRERGVRAIVRIRIVATEIDTGGPAELCCGFRKAVLQVEAEPPPR
jgi:hypothetical protein